VRRRPQHVVQQRHGAMYLDGLLQHIDLAVRRNVSVRLRHRPWQPRRAR
jgi:hypothetical protein